jgi:hypothetical protein
MVILLVSENDQHDLNENVQETSDRRPVTGEQLSPPAPKLGDGF